jgi:hypothetical protein
MLRRRATGAPTRPREPEVASTRACIGGWFRGTSLAFLCAAATARSGRRM